MRFIFPVVSVLSIVLSTFSYADQIPEEDVSKARLQLGPDRWLQFHYFLQTNLEVAKSGGKYQNDMQIKRSRLILNGQVSENIFFFAQTEDIGAGNSSSDNSSDNNADGNNKLYTQDAYINFYLNRSFQVYTGLLAIPYLRSNIQSAATSLCAVENPYQSVMTNYSNNGRDAGVMIRGIFMKGPSIEYRIGAFEGYSRSTDGKRNKNDYPRLSSRFQFSFMKGEEDDGYFVSENLIGRKNDISIGGGFDFQKSVYLNTKDQYKNYFAWTADVNLDMDMGMAVANLQSAFTMNINNPGEGKTSATDTYSSYKKFNVFYAQAGLLVFDKIQPVARYAYRKNIGTAGGDQTLSSVSGGVNYFINGHNAAVKLLYAHPFLDSADIDGEKRFDISAQIYM